MEIVAIAAIDKEMALGNKGQLLTHLPADLSNFKQLTLSHTVLMGRKTYDSIGRPLPNRENIILTREKDLSIPGCVCVNTIEQAIAQCKTNKIFIIGGGEIYAQSMHLVTQLLITRIHHIFPNADVYFPEIDEKKWKLTQEEYHPADSKHAYDFSFLTYRHYQ